MDANSYVTFLLIGVLLVVIDGQILYRGGLGYLQKVYPPDSARSVMQSSPKLLRPASPRMSWRRRGTGH